MTGERNETDEIMEFPLEFPLKVMGRNDTEFRDAVINLIRPHLAPDTQLDLSEAISKNASFVSLTVTFTADSRDQLDAIYQDVTASPLVLYTL